MSDIGGLGSGRMPQELEELAKKLEEAFNKPSKFAELFLGLKVFDYQKEFLDADARFKLFVAGRKAGKSTMTAILALHHALMTPEAEVLIVAPTMRQSLILLDKIKGFLENSDILGLGMSLATLFVTKMTKTMIEFINGSRIFSVPSGIEGRTIRGFTPTMIIVDEASYVRDEVYGAVIPSGLSTQAQIVLISTPAGKQGYFWEAYSSGRYYVVHARSYDNPLVKNDPIFLEEVKRMTKDMYKQEVEGEFVEYGRAFFSRDVILKAVSDKLTVDGDYILGVDVARYGKDSTVMTLAIKKKDRLYVKDIWEYPQSAITEVVERIIEIVNTYPVLRVYVDETGLGAGAVDLLRKEGINVYGITFTNKRKVEMYQRLKLMFEREKIRIPFHEKLIAQLLAIEVEPTKTGSIKFVVSGHDDFVDSLALLMNEFMGYDEVYILDGSLFDLPV